MTSVSTAPAAPAPASSLRSVDVDVEQHRDRLALHVRGEVDVASHDLLADQLSVVDLTGITAVDLHLAELDFCDSFGVRQLLGFADAARRAGCTVALHDTRPQLARLMTLLDPATAA